MEEPSSRCLVDLQAAKLRAGATEIPEIAHGQAGVAGRIASIHFYLYIALAAVGKQKPMALFCIWFRGSTKRAGKGRNRAHAEPKSGSVVAWPSCYRQSLVSERKQSLAP